jgi:hypothetical protein
LLFICGYALGGAIGCKSGIVKSVEKKLYLTAEITVVNILLSEICVG